jgi:hypothetical protein
MYLKKKACVSCVTDYVRLCSKDTYKSLILIMSFWIVTRCRVNEMFLEVSEEPSACTFSVAEFGSGG